MRPLEGKDCPVSVLPRVKKARGCCECYFSTVFVQWLL